MTISWWLLGLAGYLGLVCLIGAVAGFNSDDETAKPREADQAQADAGAEQGETAELKLTI